HARVEREVAELVLACEVKRARVSEAADFEAAVRELAAHIGCLRRRRFGRELAVDRDLARVAVEVDVVLQIDRALAVFRTEYQSRVVREIRAAPVEHLARTAGSLAEVHRDPAVRAGSESARTVPAELSRHDRAGALGYVL